MNTLEHIENLITVAPNIKIAVIGDLIIDEYRHGVVERISPEAPVMILRQESVTWSMGGAGNVYHNLKRMGANVALFCNYPGNTEKLWADKEAIYTNPYPCSKKMRIVAGTHQLLRVDDEIPYDQIEWFQFRNFSWWEELMDNFDWYDLFVLSDYSKGVLSDGVINTLLEFAAMNGKTVIVDAKRDLQRYSSPHVIIKCNQVERNGSLFPDKKMGYIITQGEHGMLVSDGNKTSAIRGINVNIVDVCGAGDTVTAMIALGIGAGMSLYDAANLANIAAAEVCRHPGVVPISPDGLMLSYQQTQEYISS
jgi:bifunctional ADP-heptose synthase (sugar kinase/adenylyltransferase)